MESTGTVYPYLAPTNGYVGAFTFLYRPDDPSRSGNGWERRFYARLRDGRMYGGFVVEFSPAPSKALEITGYINPSGSRVLEPDPAKRITDPDEIRRLDQTTRGQ